MSNEGKKCHEITDLHVWRVGTGNYACALSLLTHDADLTPADIRQKLAIHAEIAHVTIEIHLCDDHHEASPPSA